MRQAQLKHFEKIRSRSKEQLEAIQLQFPDATKHPIPFETIIQADIPRRYFHIFLKVEHSEENLEFWMEAERLKRVKDYNFSLRKATEMYNKYFESSSLNLSWTHREKVKNMISKDKMVNGTVFQDAQVKEFFRLFKIEIQKKKKEEIEALMKSDSYERFYRSDMYTKLLNR